MDFGQIWAILRKSGLIEMDDPPLFPPQIQAPQAKILGFLSIFLSAAGEHFAPPRAREEHLHHHVPKKVLGKIKKTEIGRTQITFAVLTGSRSHTEKPGHDWVTQPVSTDSG